MFENVNRRCRHSHAEGLLPGVYAGQCSKILNYSVHETGGTQEKVLHPEGKGHNHIVLSDKKVRNHQSFERHPLV